MKKKLIFLIVAGISFGYLTAQNSRIVSNGKNEINSEKKFSELSVNKANAIINHERAGAKQEQPKVIFKDGKYLVEDGKTNQYLKARDIKPETLTFKHVPEINSGLNPKPSLSIRKSEREDVATVTFRVIGNPLGEGMAGFHMILDADANIIEEYLGYDVDIDWYGLYNDCEYKIPENASPDQSTPNGLLDDEVSIEIPEGIYDVCVNFPAPWGNYFFETHFFVNGVNYMTEYSGFMDDFEFKAGLEYLFTAAYDNFIEFNTEYDVALSEILLPPFSLELSEQEDVTVVVKNVGILNVTDDIELSYRINGGYWTEPETLTVNLYPGDEITYIFNAKADFSEDGFYKVEAKVNYYPDLWSLNDKINGYTRKMYMRELPFYDNFNSKECIPKNWTVIDGDNDGYTWSWIPNIGADGTTGELQAGISDNNEGVHTAHDYLITDPIIIPEAGTYNISFYAHRWPMVDMEYIQILYGVSANPDDMEVLENYIITLFSIWTGTFHVKNFEIETPENYYFAFHYYTTANYLAGLSLSNVKIESGKFVGIPDIMFNKEIGIFSSCDLNSESIIGVEVYNKGTEPIYEFTLTYKINENPVVSQTFNESIGTNESIIVYFDQTADLSAIGEFKIIFTASTPDEENTDNNEMEITVNHFAPITELPFICDFASTEDAIDNWAPIEKDAWDGFSWYGFQTNANMPNAPLLSRCLTLEPGIYRFTYEYRAGLSFSGPDDFYVTYGKSRTDPYSWEPVKEHYNCMTEFELFEEDAFITITELGEYVFAFIPVNKNSIIVITSATVDIAPEHDFSIEEVIALSSMFSPRITPVYQILGENKFNVSIKNRGYNANENGTLKLSINNNDLASQSFFFSELGERKNIELKPVFESIPSENMNLNFNASNNYGVSSDYELIKIVSDSTFAYDNIDTDFFFWCGVYFEDGPGSLGMIFELAKKDILTSITLGLCDIEYSESNFGISVYPVNNDMTLGTRYFYEEYPRTAGNEIDAITFNVPDTELQPGKYFFEISQLDEEGIFIARDNNWRDGILYISSWGPQLVEDSGGYVHIRPNFGNPPVGIEKLQITNYELRIYPNPVVNEELRIDSSTSLTNLNGELIIESVLVYNAVGQVVMAVSNVNASSCSINTEKLSAGLYFISVQTNDGVVNEKFVVK